MGLKDKLLEGMDKAKGAVQSGMEKAQEKHAESQRIKNLPCLICGKPVGGWMWQHRIKGEDSYVCNDCFSKLPESMAGSKQCEEFTEDDIRTGLAFAETHVDPDDLTAKHTGFHVTDYLGGLWIDEDRLLFAIGKDLGRMPEDKDISPYMKVYSFAWLENFHFELDYDPLRKDDLRAGRIYFHIYMFFICRVPYPIPSGLSFDLDPMIAEIRPPHNRLVNIKDNLKSNVLDQSWGDMIKERVRFTEPEEITEWRLKLHTLALRAGAADPTSSVEIKKI